MDELAAAAGADAADFRLAHLNDARASGVINAVLKASNWNKRPSATQVNAGNVTRSRGISYLRYNNAITYLATVAEVEVNRTTGQILVTKVFVAHDCGQIINPDAVQSQIQAGVIPTVSRTLMEEVQLSGSTIDSVDWASDLIPHFSDTPAVQTVQIDQPGQPAWGAGEQTTTTVPATIANAFFDATGVRLRTIPFAPESVKTALKGTERKVA